MNLETIESRFPIDQFWLFLADSMWPILPNANNEEELYVKSTKEDSEMNNRRDGWVFLWCVYLFLGIFPLIYVTVNDKKKGEK